MKILPGVTQPWRTQIARRHTPQPSGYWRYRPCLRWEFGFTCAFCLLHEVDFAPLGVERLGVMQIEHFIPQSLDPALRDLYGNCFYICRLCNRARQNAPNHDPRGRGKLLNPCERSWSDTFTVVNDELLPRDSSDPDAAYTWEAYDLSDPNKTMRRRNRREAIEKRRAFLGWAREAELKLQDLALASGEKALAEQLRAHSQELRRLAALAYQDLELFSAIPRDYDRSCSCPDSAHHSLPMDLDEQSTSL